MGNEKSVECLVSSSISPLIERVVTKKLTQILDVAVKHERRKLAAAEARIAYLEQLASERLEQMTTDAEKIAELEGYNVGLANESCQQQDRIATLEKALEPFARESRRCHNLMPDDHCPASVRICNGDLRRAAALLKGKK